MSRRGIVVVGLAVLASVVVVGIAVAQESFLDGKIRIADEVIVNEDVSGNIYLFTGAATVNGRVDGDVTIVAGQATINGNVTGDVLVAAGSATISGEVSGDVRTGTGQTVVEGAVSGDVVTSAGRLQVRAGSSIGQDLIFATGQTVMNGTVDGSVVGTTGDYSVAGAVGGSQEVTVAEPPAQRSFGDRALVTLSRLVAVALVAAVAVWVLPAAIDRVAGTATDRPLPSLGWGFVGLIAIVAFFFATVLVSVLATLLFGLLNLGHLIALTWFSVIASWVLAGYGIYLLAAFGAPIAIGAVAGYLIVRQDDHSWGTRLGAIVVGLVIVVVITSLGVAGSVIGFLLFLVALGAIFLSVRDLRRRRSASLDYQEPSGPEATAGS